MVDVATMAIEAAQKEEAIGGTEDIPMDMELQDQVQHVRTKMSEIEKLVPQLLGAVEMAAGQPVDSTYSEHLHLLAQEWATKVCGGGREGGGDGGERREGGMGDGGERREGGMGDGGERREGGMGDGGERREGGGERREGGREGRRGWGREEGWETANLCTLQAKVLMKGVDDITLGMGGAADTLFLSAKSGDAELQAEQTKAIKSLASSLQNIAMEAMEGCVITMTM